MSRERRLLVALLAAWVATAPARVVVARGEAEPAPPPAGNVLVRLAHRLSVFLAVGVGLGQVGEDQPDLVNPSLALVGHLVLGIDLAHRLSLGLAAAGGRADYDNSLPPPDQVAPERRMTVTREAIGFLVEGAQPLGSTRLSAVVGGGAYLARARVSARGVLLGVSGDYASRKDVVFEGELEGGLDVRIHEQAGLGLRLGWTWLRPTFADVTRGATQIGGFTLELRLTLDVTDLRPRATR